MSESRERIDKVLTKAGLVQSRCRAQDLIRSGWVTLDGQAIKSPGKMISTADLSRVVVNDHGWVSRAALKLVHALDHFSVDPCLRAFLDLGASTGGFTEVLLNGGASRIYAVDVGHGQLSPKVSSSEYVVNLERDLSITRGFPIAWIFGILASCRNLS
jgi:23S rRNA (cytidine1920-2'-O)/16S rRNA (cytidine1409-2'-O)-methyltransferase